MLYVTETRPHDEDIFDKLEFANEVALMLLAYMTISFSGVLVKIVIGNTFAEILAFMIVAAIVGSNFYVLFMRTFKKITHMC